MIDAVPQRRKLFSLLIGLLALPPMNRAWAGVSWPREAPVYGPNHVLPTWVQRRLDNAVDVGRMRLDDLIRFEAAHNRIRPIFTLRPELDSLLVKLMQSDGAIRFTVEDCPGAWVLQRVPARYSHVALIIMTCYDVTNSGPFCCYSLNGGAGVVDINAFAFPTAGGRGQSTFGISQSDSGIRVSWNIPRGNARAPAKVNFKADERLPDLLELRTRYPDVWDNCAAPVLRRFGAGHLLHEHPAVDVYRVFNELQPEPARRDQIQHLVDQLASASFAERHAAQRALQQLGRDAVLPLLRLDSASLVPEQADRVRELLAADDWQHITKDAVTARKDLWFLLDCLDDDDPAVRNAAQAVIEAMLGARLHVDLSVRATIRSRTVDALCDQLRQAINFRESLTTQAQTVPSFGG